MHLCCLSNYLNVAHAWRKKSGKKSITIHKVISPPLNTGSKMYLQLLTFPAYYSHHKKYVFKTASSLIFNPTKAKIDTLIEKYKIKNILKNKMVAWNVIFTHTQKNPLLNCISYTNTFIFTVAGAVLCSLKLMGFCHLLHWEQEQAWHGLHLPLWKVTAVDRKEWQSTYKTDKLISPLQKPDCLLCHYFTCVKLLILHWSFS